MAYCIGEKENKKSFDSAELARNYLAYINHGKIYGKLDFYHTDDLQTVEGVLQELSATAADEHAEDITKLCKRAFGNETILNRSEGYNPQTDKDSSGVQRAKYLKKMFGTGFHACCEWALDETKANSPEGELKLDEAIDQLIEKITEMQAQLVGDLDSPETYFVGIPNRQERIDLYNFLKHFDRGVFATNVKQLLQDLREEFAGKTVRCEIPVHLKTDFINAKGRIDMIVYDTEGNLTIVDFKTSSKDFSSTEYKQYRYYQSRLYSKIFEHYKIPKEKIKLVNIPFMFSGTANTKSNIKRLTEENMNRPQFDTGSIDNLLFTQFPLKPIKNLPIEEAKQRKERLDKIANGICTDLHIRKGEEEAIENYILKCIDRKDAYFCRHQGKEINVWTIDGDIYTGKNHNGDIIFKGTLKQLVKKEAEQHLKESEDNIAAIRGILIDKDQVRLQGFLRTQSLQKQFSFYHSLYTYMSPNWKYVNVPSLEAQNVITMYNVDKDYYEFIVVIPDAGMVNYIRDPKANILKNVMRDQSELQNVRQFSELPPPSTKNMCKTRALMAIAEFSDLLKQDGKPIVISGVKTLSSVSGAGDNGRGIEGFLTAFQLMEYEAFQNPDKIEEAEYIKEICQKMFNDITFLETDKERYQEFLIHQAQNALSIVALDHDTDIRLSSADLTAKADELDSLLDYIKETYPNVYDSKTNPVGILYADLAELTLRIRNLAPEEMYAMNKRSLTFQESILAGVDLLRYGDCARFTKMGLRLTGLAQALETTVSYASPDELIRRGNSLFNAVSQRLVDELVEEAVEVNNACKKYTKYAQRNLIRKVTGNNEDVYKVLFKKGEDGKPLKDMIFINPYNTKELTPEQQEFLEIILWSINKHRMAQLDIDPKYLKMTYAELKENKTGHSVYVQLIRENPELLYVPLKEKGGAVGTFSNLKAVITGTQEVGEFIKKETDKWKSYIEPTILNEEQAKQQEKNIKELKWTNFYKNVGNRSQMTNSHEVDQWECNLNKLVLDFIAADLKEVYFTKLLNVVDRQLATIRLAEIVTGEDLSNQTEALWGRIKVSIYNKSLTESEDEDVLKLMGAIKGVHSLAKIAVRPALFIKEMLLGRIRNTAAILSKQIVNDSDIKMSHLMDAAKFIFSGDMFREENKSFRKLLGGKTIGDFSWVDQVNTAYQINDRDLNVIGETLAYDRTGVHNWGSRMLYLNTIAPDSFNRMIIFVAKMMADGTFEAHTLNSQTGKLEYNMDKDERFEYFWKNRDRDMQTDRKWVDQKELYIIKMQQFAAEGWTNPDGSPLSWGQDGKFDPLPRAYTSQESDSIKEQIGLIYGYYGHEERANMQKGWWWTMYTEFMTFLPAEIRRYFANGNTKTSIGKTVHQKDPISGKLMYWKPETTGKNIDRKVVAGTNNVSEDGIDQETGQALRPVLAYEHNELEGLAVSTAKVVGQICRGDWKTLRSESNAQRIRNTELFFFNLLFGFLVAMLIKHLISLGVGEDSPGAAAGLDLMNKVGTELNFIHTISGAVDSFGLVGMDFIQETLSSAAKTMSVDGYSIADFANNTFSIVKDTHLVEQ